MAPLVPTIGKQTALSESVYFAILQMLATGALQRGGLLRIDLLSEALGVSPTPVREALARLAVTGLVVHEQRKGYRVAPPPTRTQIVDLMEARRIIEVGAIKIACARGGADFAKDLSKALKDQGRLVKMLCSKPARARDALFDLEWKIIEADQFFHRVILKHTQNKFVVTMTASIEAQLHRVRQNTEIGFYDYTQALDEHSTICAAVERNDSDAAQLAMKEHIDRVEQRSLADFDMAESTRQDGGDNRAAFFNINDGEQDAVAEPTDRGDASAHPSRNG